MKYSVLTTSIILLALPSCLTAQRGPSVEAQVGHSWASADAGTQATGVRAAYLTREDELTSIRGVVAVGWERPSYQDGLAHGNRYEADLGLRGRVWGPFYLGVGFAPTFLAVSADGESASKFFLAGYGEVGAEFDITEHLSAGVCYRHTFGATASLGDGPRENLNEGVLAAAIGWGF